MDERVADRSAAATTGGPPDHRLAPRWVAPLFSLLALGITPWIGYLAVTLEPATRTVHYRAAWVGFDILLLAVLASTAYFALRGSPQVAFTATAAATLLVVDAWFDVLTTPKDDGRILSVVLAVLVELPLAALCLWIATHARHVLHRRVELLARRAQRAERIAASTPQLAAGVGLWHSERRQDPLRHDGDVPSPCDTGHR